MHADITLERARRAEEDAGFCTVCGYKHRGIDTNIIADKCHSCGGHYVWHVWPLIAALNPQTSPSRTMQLVWNGRTRRKGVLTSTEDF